MISKLWDDIKNFFAPSPKEPGVWDKDQKTKKSITQEEISEAVKEMGITKPGKPYGLIFLQGFTILWMLGHFGLLYVGIGTPLSIGILIYVLINSLYLSHYLILLRQTKGPPPDE